MQKEDYPDYGIIDLNPAKNTLDKAIEAAQVKKKALESAGVNASSKTSGSTGIHIYIPLFEKYTYE